MKKKLKFTAWVAIISMALFFVASIVSMCTAEDTVVHEYCIMIMALDLVFTTPFWMWFMFAIDYPNEIYRN